MTPYCTSALQRVPRPRPFLHLHLRRDRPLCSLFAFLPRKFLVFCSFLDHDVLFNHSYPRRDRGSSFAAAKHVAHAIHGYRLTLGGTRLNRVGYDGKGKCHRSFIHVSSVTCYTGTLGWTTSGIVYDSGSGSGVSLVVQGSAAGRGCVETGNLEQVRTLSSGLFFGERGLVMRI